MAVFSLGLMKTAPIEAPSMWAGQRLGLVSALTGKGIPLSARNPRQESILELTDPWNALVRLSSIGG